MPAILDPTVLLFGSTRRRVLGWLLGHADEAYYLRELVRHTGGAVGAVQRELGQLTAVGLVRRDVRGRQVYFQANRQAAIFPELQGLFTKTAGLVDILREGLTPLAGDVRAAFVFGSAGAITSSGTSRLVMKSNQASRVNSVKAPRRLRLSVLPKYNLDICLRSCSMALDGTLIAANMSATAAGNADSNLSAARTGRSTGSRERSAMNSRA